MLKKGSRSKSLCFVTKPYSPLTQQTQGEHENSVLEGPNDSQQAEKLGITNQSNTRESFLPRISGERRYNGRRKSSVYFAASPKFIPIPSYDSSGASFHRRPSIKMSKSGLNRIPLRRLSLNVPLSNEFDRKMSFPELRVKREKSDSKIDEPVRLIEIICFGC